MQYLSYPILLSQNEMKCYIKETVKYTIIVKHLLGGCNLHVWTDKYSNLFSLSQLEFERHLVIHIFNIHI